MFDNIDWCDVDSDDDFCIPDLPPLPLVKCLSFPSAAIAKEEQITCSSVTLSETSERSSSAAGSRQSSTCERPQKRSDRFRFNFDRESSFKSKKGPDYVCFIGKFPQQTTIADMTNFVKSKGINFTDVRIGPKKKPNANAFGYVDLPTKKDYDKLLALDGSLYRGRRIRIDHATRKDPCLHRKKTQTRKGNQSVGFGSARHKTYQSKSSYNRPRLQKAHSDPIARKKTQVHRKPRTESRRFGCSKATTRSGYKTVNSKATARSQRYKTIMRSQKRGPRNKQKYLKSPKNNGANTSTRFLEPSGRKERSF